MKHFFYLILPFFCMLCSFISCADDNEEATDNIISKFEGKWCVTNTYYGPEYSTLDLAKYVGAYWSVSRDNTYTLYKTSNDVTGTFADGVLNANNIEWQQTTSNFTPTAKSLDLGLFKGDYEFVDADRFYLYKQDGERLTFSRIKNIKQ